MKVGLLIPTQEETPGLPAALRAGVGFGPGKAASCAAAARLLYQEGCDALLVWGTAGAFPRAHLHAGEVVAATAVAYSDYDVSPLYGSDGMGFVPEIAPECWMPGDPALTGAFCAALARHFPDQIIRKGRISAGDLFDNARYGDPANRIEAVADAADMESPAILHFCRLTERVLGRRIPVAVVRMISNQIGGTAAEEYQSALERLAPINAAMPDLLEEVSVELKSLGES